MEHNDSKHTKISGQLDLLTMVVPFVIILLLCAGFFLAPEASKQCLESIRFFLQEAFGTWYLAVGLGIFLLSLYLAFSRYGTIRLGGKEEKPQ